MIELLKTMIYLLEKSSLENDWKWEISLLLTAIAKEWAADLTKHVYEKYLPFSK